MTRRFVVATLASIAAALIAGCAGMNGIAPQASPRDSRGLASSLALQNAAVTDAAWPTTDWSMGVGPAITLPIFDAGRLRANLAEKDADYDIAVEQYNQTLADAMRDVVDQLVSSRSVDEQRTHLGAAITTTRDAYELALVRYREGLGNYVQVLSAEQPLLVQQGLDADLRARALEIAINLVRALGGGFEPRAEPTAFTSK